MNPVAFKKLIKSEIEYTKKILKKPEELYDEETSKEYLAALEKVIEIHDKLAY